MYSLWYEYMSDSDNPNVLYHSQCKPIVDPMSSHTYITADEQDIGS